MLHTANSPQPILTPEPHSQITGESIFWAQWSRADVGATKGREQVNPALTPHEETHKDQQCMICATTPLPDKCTPFYWASFELDRQQSAEMESGRDVLRGTSSIFQPKPTSALHFLSCLSFRPIFWNQEKMQFPARCHLPPSSPRLLTLHSYLCHKIMVVGERPSAKEKGRVMPRKSHHQVSPALLATGDTQHETRHPDATASSYRTFLPCEAAGK